MTRERGDRGQASIELLGALPLLAALVLASWQLVILGESWWLAGIAARAGARAELVGGDVARSARAALPPGWARRVAVHGGTGAAIVVRVRVPAVVLGRPLGTVGATVAAGSRGP